MKWIVQLDYEFGEFEPNSIYFRRVCSDDIEYGSAYDTKREALEAFCQGQYAINQLRKEREAEQKKGEKKKSPCDGCKNAEWYPHGWHCNRFGRQIKMDRETCIADEREEEQRKFVDLSRYCKTAIFDPSKPTIEERLEALEKKVEERMKDLREGQEPQVQEEEVKQQYGDGFLPPEGYTNGKEQKIMERLEALEEAIHKPYIPFSVREAKDIVYKYQAKVKALENRLTEIEGVLTSIGSPDYDLRKKVDDLEKKHRRLIKDYKTHLCVNHNYTMTQKDIELIRQYEPEE